MHVSSSTCMLAPLHACYAEVSPWRYLSSCGRRWSWTSVTVKMSSSWGCFCTLYASKWSVSAWGVYVYTCLWYSFEIPVQLHVQFQLPKDPLYPKSLIFFTKDLDTKSNHMYMRTSMLMYPGQFYVQWNLSITNLWNVETFVIETPFCFPL